MVSKHHNCASVCICTRAVAAAYIHSWKRVRVIVHWQDVSVSAGVFGAASASSSFCLRCRWLILSIRWFVCSTKKKHRHNRLITYNFDCIKWRRVLCHWHFGEIRIDFVENCVMLGVILKPLPKPLPASTHAVWLIQQTPRSALRC